MPMSSWLARFVYNLYRIKSNHVYSLTVAICSFDILGLEAVAQREDPVGYKIRCARGRS